MSELSVWTVGFLVQLLELDGEDSHLLQVSQSVNDHEIPCCSSIQKGSEKSPAAKVPSGLKQAAGEDTTFQSTGQM